MIPLLAAENPRLHQTVSRSSALIRAEDAYLSAAAKQAAADCRRGAGWSCEALLALDPVLRRRVLLGILSGLPLQTPQQIYVDALERLLALS